MTLYEQIIAKIADDLTPPAPPTIDRDGLHVGQLHVLNNLAKYNVLVAGRRWGKSHLAMQYIREQLAQGQRGWYTALTYGNVEAFWRSLASEYRRHDVKKSTRDIYTNEGGYIGVRSLNNYDNLRGAGLDFVIVDEAAFVSPIAWYEVLSPMLIDNDGSAMFMSSPKGRNWFYDLYTLGNDDNLPAWRSFHYTTYDNPLLSKSAIDTITKPMTARVYAEEILAEFNDSDGAVFRNVRTCATAQSQSEPVEDHRYVFGVDWGRDNDYTVLVVIDTTTSELVHIDRFNQIDYTLQQGRLKSAYERWHPDIIIAEANAMGQPNIDALRRDGLPIRAFTTTQKSKAQIIESLALAFETEQIHIIDHPILIHELISYEQSRTQGGAFKFSAPEGQHDDCVMALAIGWSQAGRVLGDEIPTIEF